MRNLGNKGVRIEGVRRYCREDENGNELVYYTGVLPSDIAKEVTFVPVMRDLAGQKSPLNEIRNGYQRPGSGTRMRQFSKYLAGAPLAIVPPVLLSTRDKWTFIESDDADFGDLEIDGPAAIIDGQHRMGGFIHLFEAEDEVRDIDFVAFEHLTAKQEAQVFNTINGNAKGVPKGVGKIIEDSWSTRVVTLLKEEKDSPFYEKIFIAAKREIDGALFNLSSMDKEVRRTFMHGAFSGIVADENIELMYEILKVYWELIAEHFPEEWQDVYLKPKDQDYKLLELTGIIAFSLAASDILGPNFDADTLEMDWEQVRAVIEALSASGELDLSKDGDFEGFAGLVGGPKIHRRIQKILGSLDL
jgi:DNA sulfur modification protein DndB